MVTLESPLKYSPIAGFWPTVTHPISPLSISWPRIVLIAASEAGISFDSVLIIMPSRETI